MFLKDYFPSCGNHSAISSIFLGKIDNHNSLVSALIEKLSKMVFLVDKMAEAVAVLAAAPAAGQAVAAANCWISGRSMISL